VATEVGTLVTVTTRLTIDTGSTSFTVLIPAISLSDIADHQTLATEAIVTNHTGPNSFPFTGVHEMYQFIPLNGTASFVLTLFQLVQEGVAKVAKP
jgi:hypothetical protein